MAMRNSKDKETEAAMREGTSGMIRLGLIELRADGKMRLAEFPGIFERDATGVLRKHPDYAVNLARLFEEQSAQQ